MEVARMLGWKENQVRVRAAFLGGGFGAKLYIKLEALVAVLALIVRRPVRIGLTMEEQFYTITKHGTTVHMKTGVKNDGTIVAREVDDVLERRRVCRYRSARHAEVRLHRRRPVRHRERLARYLRVLYELAAGRRVPRLRHSATRVGVRVASRHDRAQARASIR